MLPASMPEQTTTWSSPLRSRSSWQGCRALLRRSSWNDQLRCMKVGDLTLECRELAEVEREPTMEIALTKTEFDLLELLMRNSGIVIERGVIYEKIWGYDFETTSNSLDVYVGYLRRKTEPDNASRLIHTVRGVGYVARES